MMYSYDTVQSPTAGVPRIGIFFKYSIDIGRQHHT